MQSSHVFIILLILAIAAFVVGRWRSIQLKNAGQQVHSLPFYHGMYFAICTSLLPLAILGLWMFTSHYTINSWVMAALPPDILAQSPGDRSLSISMIDSLAEQSNTLSVAEIATLRSGGDAATTILTQHHIGLSQNPQSFVIDAALHKAALVQSAGWIVAALCLALAALGFYYAWRKQAPELRARNQVEELFRYVLMAASSIAIFNTNSGHLREDRTPSRFGFYVTFRPRDAWRLVRLASDSGHLRGRTHEVADECVE